MKNIESKLGYEFKNKLLLENALTHSSYIHNKSDKVAKSNQRLEFLGDAFLDAIISEELYTSLPDMEEGRLTKIRASVVCAGSLAAVGKSIGIGEHIFLGTGERRTGGSNKDSITADAMEALIGAIYLDGGYTEAREFILKHFGKRLKTAMDSGAGADYKTSLQEILQAVGEKGFFYRVRKEAGPDHEKTFEVELVLHDTVIGRGNGMSKKEAEQNAAKEAIERRGSIVF